VVTGSLKVFALLVEIVKIVCGGQVQAKCGVAAALRFCTLIIHALLWQLHASEAEMGSGAPER
jgi:hypothetical protein